MESKFKLGDIFTKKHTRDTIPIEIYEISYDAIEPIYKLKPIRLCGDDVILGEEALIELYNKINQYLINYDNRRKRTITERPQCKVSL